MTINTNDAKKTALNAFFVKFRSINFAKQILLRSFFLGKKTDIAEKLFVARFAVKFFGKIKILSTLKTRT